MADADHQDLDDVVEEVPCTIRYGVMLVTQQKSGLSLAKGAIRWLGVEDSRAFAGSLPIAAWPNG